MKFIQNHFLRRHITRLLIVLPIAVFIGCDGYVSVNGTVTDPTGRPVDEALVVLKPAPGYESVGKSTETTTGSTGEFHVSMSYKPVQAEFTLQITKDGYAPHEKTITAADHSGNLNNYNLTLNPIP